MSAQSVTPIRSVRWSAVHGVWLFIGANGRRNHRIIPILDCCLGESQFNIDELKCDRQLNSSWWNVKCEKCPESFCKFHRSLRHCFLFLHLRLWGWDVDWFSDPWHVCGWFFSFTFHFVSFRIRRARFKECNYILVLLIIGPVMMRRANNRCTHNVCASSSQLEWNAFSTQSIH